MDKAGQLILQNRFGKVNFTYGDLLGFLQSLQATQLDQPVMILRLKQTPDPDLLDKGIGIGTIEELCHVNGEIIKETRGPDFAHHPEQIAILIDGIGFDIEGNTSFTMERINGEIMFRGNVTKKLYPL